MNYFRREIITRLQTETNKTTYIKRVRFNLSHAYEFLRRMNIDTKIVQIWKTIIFVKPRECCNYAMIAWFHELNNKPNNQQYFFCFVMGNCMFYYVKVDETLISFGWFICEIEGDGFIYFVFKKSQHIFQIHNLSGHETMERKKMIQIKIKTSITIENNACKIRILKWNQLIAVNAGTQINNKTNSH